jgi:putative ABC transport system permease protein
MNSSDSQFAENVQKWLPDLTLGIENLSTRKLRSLLTMLGMIFGVAAVVAMLSIGAGAQQKVMAFIEQLGVRNLIIEAKEAVNWPAMQKVRRVSPGLTLNDYEVLRKGIPGIEESTPRKRVQPSKILPKPQLDTPVVYGVNAGYLVISNLRVVDGRFFTPQEDSAAAPVCVLGAAAKDSIFGASNALGEYVKLNDQWFHVIGVVAPQANAQADIAGIRNEDQNNLIYAPLHSVISRLEENMAWLKDEIDGIYLQLASAGNSPADAEIARGILNTTHHDAGDFSIVVPAELLAQQKRTEQLFNSVMVAIASISLLDIYRSESEVAARRVNVIQIEYSLKQAEDQLRQLLAANRDSAINGLDLQLTEKPEPTDTLLQIDIATAMSMALANRPELEAVSQQLASDALSVRLAHNNLRPDLELGGFYQPTGLGGNQYSTAVPPVLLSTGGIGESLSQMFGLKYPTYGLTLNLRLPIKNHGAEADLADALVTQRGDQYRQARTVQTVNLDVTNAVHLLEQSKLTLEAAKVARDLAQKSLQAEERKYQLGNNTVFFVLDAQTQLAQAELALVQAQTGYQTAVAGIDHATGKLLDRHQIKPLPPHN